MEAVKKKTLKASQNGINDNKHILFILQVIQNEKKYTYFQKLNTTQTHSKLLAVLNYRYNLEYRNFQITISIGKIIDLDHYLIGYKSKFHDFNHQLKTGEAIHVFLFIYVFHIKKCFNKLYHL